MLNEGSTYTIRERLFFQSIRQQYSNETPFTFPDKSSEETNKKSDYCPMLHLHPPVIARSGHRLDVGDCSTRKFVSSVLSHDVRMLDHAFTKDSVVC